MNVVLVVLLLILSVLSQAVEAQGQGCSLKSPRKTRYYQDGDVLIGALIPMHINWQQPIYHYTEPLQRQPCPAFSVLSYGWVQALIFALSEINANQSILPNVTLGFLVYDTCLMLEHSLQSTLQMLTGQETPILNYQCGHGPALSAIFGDTMSTDSIAVARLLGLYRQPQISYSSSSPILSNKQMFPSFFRTVPSDDTQAQLLAELVIHFGWTWIGMLSTEDDYGRMGSQILRSKLLKSGVCFAFDESFPSVSTESRVLFITKIVKRSSARVILIFSSDPYLTPVMKELVRHNVSGKVWIGSEGWSTSPILLTEGFAKMLKGTIGLTPHTHQISGFTEFLLKVHPSTLPDDIFVKSFWEQAIGCHWPNQESFVALPSGELIQTNLTCTGNEKLEKFSSKYYDDFKLRNHYTIYNAAYVVAHSLMNMVSCIPGQGFFHKDKCATLRTFKPWQLLHYMKSVRFKNKMGEEMYFDEHGNPPSIYSVLNWQIRPDGGIHYVKVGTFDARSPTEQKLSINMSAIQWNQPGTEVPRSVCSESCPSGFWKAAQKGQPSCCFNCNPCSEGEISNETDSISCWACPSELWPNWTRTECIPKRIEYLSYHEPLGATLASVASLSSLSTAAILLVFLRNCDTAIVKANNRELTYLLLGSLILSFLCSFFFIGVPRRITCLLRQSAFGIIFVLCVSCVLAKTIMVVLAFNATKPNSKMKRWLGPSVPVVTISVGTLGQVLLCFVWLLLCPPFPEKNMKVRTGVIIFQCNECSEAALWSMLGYLGFLACVSFLVAFLARKLPDSFNEAKWITFSMLVFLSVWLSFIPGYLSTQGKYMVAVEVFAIISSSAGLLICIFFPKCYIIVLRPERNTREHILGKRIIKKK
ncbi:extracellular calcium-sensing receptor-like [Pleurodeles waltl]|uniref:extracellular calcium-sensing receptor-like n=1 Tax=Pleurodeles waltl TaxID=8319 RepID=UPI0037099282